MLSASNQFIRIFSQQRSGAIAREVLAGAMRLLLSAGIKNPIAPHRAHRLSVNAADGATDAVRRNFVLADVVEIKDGYIESFRGRAC